MDTGEKIKQLRQAQGLTLEAVGNAVGVGKSTVRKWENGMIANMKRDKIASLAKVLKTTPEYLIGWSEELPRGIIPISELSFRTVPVLGNIAAGSPIIAQREWDEFAPVPSSGHKYDYALRVCGDSMSPVYLDGDLVLIRAQDDVEDGQTAAVCLDDEVTLKHLYHIPGGVQLVSENRKYAPMTFTASDHDSIRVLGLAVGYLRWTE